MVVPRTELGAGQGDVDVVELTRKETVGKAELGEQMSVKVFSRK